MKQETYKETDKNRPRWLQDYERDLTVKGHFSPESPDSRGLDILARLYGRILPDLKKRGVADAPDALPKDVSKWAVLPDWLALMEKHPHTQRNVFDWLDSCIPASGLSMRGGALNIRRLPELSTAREKQYGQGFNDPTPSFTFHGERLPYRETRELAEKWMRSRRDEYPDKYVYDLDVESMDSWNNVLGGRASTYVLCESSILFHGMTPHQETHSPIPWDICRKVFDENMEREFPGFLDPGTNLNPAHLFVSTATGGGITIGNADGAAGYPYTNMDRKEVRKALGRPKFKGRATKGVVFQHALRSVANWIKAGMPMSGPEYEAVAQPATLAYRGDRAVDLNLRALASRGQLAEGHDASNQLAAMLPSRSVIIVPTAAVLMQSSWAQPLGNHIAGAGTPGFDWVDPDHSVTRLNEIRQLDLQQSGVVDGQMASVGADASGWDRDVTGQMHALETAWYMSMFPKDVSLLYVDAKLPLDVSPEWVSQTDRKSVV